VTGFVPESPVLKLVEYFQSQQFNRILCLGLAVASHGLSIFAVEAATPPGDHVIVKRAQAFHSFVFNGSNNTTS